MYLFPCFEKDIIESIIRNLLDNGLFVAPGQIFGYDTGFRLTLFSNQNKMERIYNIIQKVLNDTKK